MHDRRDRLVAVVESGNDAPASVLRKIEAVAFDVDVVLVLLVPVRDHRRLVAQGAPQTLLNLAGACTFGDGAEDRTDSGAACDRGPEQAGEEDERHGREGRDQGDADDGRSDSGERRDDEPDRQQHDAEASEEVDRPEDATEPRRCLPPATEEQHDDRREQQDRSSGPDRGRDDVRGMILGDQHEVVGTRVRLARFWRGEHGLRERSEERDRVARADEHSRASTEQATTWIRQQQMHEGRDEEASEERPEGERDRMIRLPEDANQDAKADRDHQHSRAVLRPPGPADQPGEDERRADEQNQSNRLLGVLLVVARGCQRDGEPVGDQGGQTEVQPGAPGKRHATSRAAIAAPDRSAFGTKPQAPHTLMQGP